VVVDTTAGGDAFASGFLSHLVQGASLRESMTFAAASTASVLRFLGAQTGILRTAAPPHRTTVTEEVMAL
jgi:sugar/nucleoside kinase (ribokinase family)